MTSYCRSYPEATAVLNLPALLSAQGENKWGERGDSSEQAKSPAWSQLLALQETLQTLKIMSTPQMPIPSAWKKKQLYLPR